MKNCSKFKNNPVRVGNPGKSINFDRPLVSEIFTKKTCQMKKALLIFLGVGIFFLSCQKESKQDWVATDLLKYGIPITIMAPDSALVKADDLGGGLIKDVTIKGDDNYSIQIYATQATTNDMAQVKAGQLAEVKGNRYFSRIVMEESDGFIYETVIDSSNINYGFRHIRIQGDVEYIFQTGLIGQFTQDEAQRLYAAVRPQ